jgi:hypothetical protein
MKPEHVLTSSIAAVGAIMAIEMFYRHPTCGRGWQAILAVARFGLVF